MELEHWRSRMTRLNALAEQLQGGDHRTVAAVCSAAAIPTCARWRDLELRLADAAAEAKETVKYLTTLEGSLECIYTSAQACGWVHRTDCARGGQTVGIVCGAVGCRC